MYFSKKYFWMSIMSRLAALDVRLLNVGGHVERRSGRDQEGRLLARFQRADAIVESQELCGVDRHRLQGLLLGEPERNGHARLEGQPVRIQRPRTARNRKAHARLVEARRHRVGAVVALVWPPGSGHRRGQDHRDVLGDQAIGHVDGVPPAADDDPQVLLLRPGDGVVDLGRAVGCDHDGEVPVDDRDHGGVTGVAAHLRTGGDRVPIGPGFREEVLELLDLLFVARRVLALLTEPEAAESAEPAGIGIRPVHVERRGRLHRHLFPAPSLEGHRGRHAGDESAAGRRERREHAGRARGADVAALGVHGDIRAHVRVEVAQFVDVVGDAHRADLGDPHGAEGVDEPGIDVLAGRIDHAGPGRDLHVGPDRGDQPVLQEDRPVLDHTAGDRVNGGALQCHGLGLRWHGHAHLRPEGCRHRRAQDRQGRGGHGCRARPPRKGSPHRSSLRRRRHHRFVSVWALRPPPPSMDRMAWISCVRSCAICSRMAASSSSEK